ncbi:6-phosphogluconate dehydrogenase (decarboxylating) [Granulicatella balaenopterae]|uniref:6-phosphogluconate dehydrogenase (Decarboxylating) n=1 Tax=Granulicatella balaenopterae TaxID=137733 RepID=A0A1H9P4Q6_9LACT|nr:decarboxylating 6-phosphogluconate dehydrogenase [Granulicatella balaenopterae]SER42865.1 6-phosphogluconate dehydrogenase (decarboxylating) [Granulicatella balaenopterae]
MKVNIIGLGKMGLNLALNLQENGYQVMGYDLSESMRNEAEKEGVMTVGDLEKLLSTDNSEQRITWVMVPAGDPTESTLNTLLAELNPNDIVIEGGNSNYKDSIRRAKSFEEKNIYYFDCGTSGGMTGARNGGCFMIGGNEEGFKVIEPIFKAISVENGYLYTGESGSGHFLKMIHNGVEYGMMQAIGEGFQVVEQSDFEYDLESVARVWNNGSVIRSWLIELAEEQFKNQPHLENYKGIANASGEAKWTVETALELDVPVPVIATSLFMRNTSQEEDSFSAKVVAALRNGFGGHDFIKNN